MNQSHSVFAQYCEKVMHSHLSDIERIGAHGKQNPHFIIIYIT